AENLARAAQPQILLGDAEAVVGLAHQREPSTTHLDEVGTADQEANALPRPSPDASPQLVQLGQPEALGPLDDHQGRIRNVDPNLDHGCGNQHRELSAGEASHHRILFRALHSAVDEPDLVVAKPQLEDSRALFGSGGVALLAL